MPLGDGLEHVTGEPLAELHHPFLICLCVSARRQVARGAEIAAFTLEVILYALVVRGQMSLSGPVDRAGFGHRFVHRKTGDEGGSHSEGSSKGKRCARGVDGVRKHGRAAVQIWPGAQQGILSADGTRWVSENEDVAGCSQRGEHEHGMGQRITLHSG